MHGAAISGHRIAIGIGGGDRERAVYPGRERGWEAAEHELTGCCRGLGCGGSCLAFRSRDRIHVSTRIAATGARRFYGAVGCQMIVAPGKVHETDGAPTRWIGIVGRIIPGIRSDEYVSLERVAGKRGVQRSRAAADPAGEDPIGSVWSNVIRENEPRMGPFCSDDGVRTRYRVVIDDDTLRTAGLSGKHLEDPSARPLAPAIISKVGEEVVLHDDV